MLPFTISDCILPKKTYEELLEEYLLDNKVKILFGIISNTSYVNSGYCQSMIQIASKFTKYNIDFDIISIQNETISSRGKNCVIAKFLSDKSYTHLMFIDTNISFSWKSICDLLMSNKEVCSGVYPTRKMNYNKMSKIILNSKEINVDHLLAKSMNYNFNPILYMKLLNNK